MPENEADCGVAKSHSLAVTGANSVRWGTSNAAVQQSIKFSLLRSKGASARAARPAPALDRQHMGSLGVTVYQDIFGTGKVERSADYDGQTAGEDKMLVEKDTKNKLVDEMGAAKINGMIGISILAAGLGGGRVVGEIIPRPVNMWKNQRRSRAFQDALEEAGIPLDFRVKVTFKNEEPKICSLTWASWDIGCDKWELAYHLAKDGSCFFGVPRCSEWVAGR